jgi:hypothetical protein
LQAALLGRFLQLFAEIALADRCFRRSSQSRILRQNAAAEEAQSKLKLRAIRFMEGDVHRCPPRETAKKREMGLPPETMKTAYGTRLRMSDLLSKDCRLQVYHVILGQLLGEPLHSLLTLLLNFAPEMMQRK